ncbi:MAG: hypothetical protein HYV60_01455 [Planctomycetia bacterium]|nr:hypothetical protein [Planctomycetia bacterium]
MAKKEMAGKTVRCPRCSNPLTLPGPFKIETSCRHCGQRFMADEDLAGKVVKCPMCTRPITVAVPGGSQVVTPQIEVTCGCGQQFVATRDLAGRKVKCTACGSTIVVPQAERK